LSLFLVGHEEKNMNILACVHMTTEHENTPIS